MSPQNRLLCRAVDFGSVAAAREALDAGASLESGRHCSVLCTAVKLRDVEMVRFLIARGASLLSDSCKPVKTAIQEGHLPVLRVVAEAFAVMPPEKIERVLFFAADQEEWALSRRIFAAELWDARKRAGADLDLLPPVFPPILFDGNYEPLVETFRRRVKQVDDIGVGPGRYAGWSRVELRLEEFTEMDVLCRALDHFPDIFHQQMIALVRYPLHHLRAKARLVLSSSRFPRLAAVLSAHFVAECAGFLCVEDIHDVIECCKRIDGLIDAVLKEEAAVFGRTKLRVVPPINLRVTRRVVEGPSVFPDPRIPNFGLAVVSSLADIDLDLFLANFPSVRVDSTMLACAFLSNNERMAKRLPMHLTKEEIRAAAVQSMNLGGGEKLDRLMYSVLTNCDVAVDHTHGVKMNCFPRTILRGTEMTTGDASLAFGPFDWSNPALRRIYLEEAQRINVRFFVSLLPTLPRLYGQGTPRHITHRALLLASKRLFSDGAPLTTTITAPNICSAISSVLLHRVMAAEPKLTAPEWAGNAVFYVLCEPDLPPEYWDARAFVRKRFPRRADRRGTLEHIASHAVVAHHGHLLLDPLFPAVVLERVTDHVGEDLSLYLMEIKDT